MSIEHANGNGTWTRRPDSTQAVIGLPLLRCPPKGKIQGVVLSDDVSGRDLHFYHGRSTPCSGESCEACSAGIELRWKGYLAMMGGTGGKVCLVEFPAAAGVEISNHRDLVKSLRGHVLTLERRGKRPNGPVFASFSGMAREVASLPVDPPVREILNRMWAARLRSARSRLILPHDAEMEQDLDAEAAIRLKMKGVA